eukprot:gene26895-biopygen17478
MQGVQRGCAGHSESGRRADRQLHSTVAVG